MNVTDLKVQMHMQEWSKLIEARQDSGLSIKEWRRIICLSPDITTILKNCVWQLVKGSPRKVGMDHNLLLCQTTLVSVILW